VDAKAVLLRRKNEESLRKIKDVIAEELSNMG
jgi:hypothetical protein